MKKSNLFSVLALIAVVSMLLSACSGEVLMDPQTAAGNPVDPTKQAEAVAAGPQASQVNLFDHMAIVAKCTKPADQYFSDELGGQVVICKSFTGTVSILDAAMVASLATPFPGDEEIVGAIWLGDKIVKIILIGAATYQGVQVIDNVMLMSRHSDQSHNPNFPNTQARTNIASAIAAWTTILTQAKMGGPENSSCGAVKSGDEIVRWVIWIADKVRATGGFQIIINPANPQAPYTGSYDISRTEWEGGMDKTKLAKMGQTWSFDIPCPGSIPSLQAATAK